MICPKDSEGDTQLLTGEDALISVEDFVDSGVIDGSDLVQTNETSQVLLNEAAEFSPTQGMLTEEIFPCTNCHKAYNARRNLLRHINSECGKEPKYMCTFCDYKNYRRNEIVNHIKKKHKSNVEIFTPMC